MIGGFIRRREKTAKLEEGVEGRGVEVGPTMASSAFLFIFLFILEENE